MLVKKFGKKYIVCRRARGSGNSTGKREKKVYRNWFLIKTTNNSTGMVSLNKILLPKELVGKRVRFIVEEVI